MVFPCIIAVWLVAGVPDPFVVPQSIIEEDFKARAIAELTKPGSEYVELVREGIMDYFLRSESRSACGAEGAGDSRRHHLDELLSQLLDRGGEASARERRDARTRAPLPPSLCREMFNELRDEVERAGLSMHSQSEVSKL